MRRRRSAFERSLWRALLLGAWFCVASSCQLVVSFDRSEIADGGAGGSAGGAGAGGSAGSAGAGGAVRFGGASGYGGTAGAAVAGID